MRLLVLGGTAQLGYAVAAEAVARGHEVVCAARGVTGPIPDGATLVTVDRDAPDGLAALADDRFDDVVDVAKISYPWVADALRVLGPRAAHWTFVSTINVYADHSTPGMTPDAPLLDPVREDGAGRQDPDLYGAIKVASEDAVREALGDRAFIVRPGLITGPGDVTDRFGYWPARFAEPGPVLVPDVPDQPAQYIDVRDLAAWIVDAGERKLIGTFDGIGPTGPFTELLAGIADAVGNGDVELVKASEAQLAAAEVTPWAGPKSLPLWTPSPETHGGFLAHDVAPSIEAGLRLRPLADAALGALRRERELGVHRDRKAGLSRAAEAEVIAGL